MPKPIVGDKRQRHARHQSLAKDGKNLFTGEATAACPRPRCTYIGGILKHAKTINAFTNPGTNSYKAPCAGLRSAGMLAYSARNRSASIASPSSATPRAAASEVRFPDSTATRTSLRGDADGRHRRHPEQIHPGDRRQDLYHCRRKEDKKIPGLPQPRHGAGTPRPEPRLPHRRRRLHDDLIDAYIELKMQEVTRFRMTTHPIEFDMY